MIELNIKLKRFLWSFLIITTLLFLQLGQFSIQESISTSKQNTSFSNSSLNAETLTIAKYRSLMAWGEDPYVDLPEKEISWDEIETNYFDSWAANHGLTLNWREFDDAGEMFQILLQEKDNPTVDIIVGLDNTLAQEAIKRGLYQKYTPNQSIMDPIPVSICNGLDTSGYLTPYDYGLISLIIHEGSLDLGTNFTLQDIINNDLAKKMITQDPATSSTGLGFLLWTISVYEKVLNQTWENWWQDVADDIKVAKSWEDAWVLWDKGTADILVSYGTDPAFSNYFYDATNIAAYVSNEGGNPIGWVQIEGIGITPAPTGTKLDNAKAFVDYFLSTDIQTLIPRTNWMFPANNLVDLPEAYQYAIHPDNVTLLNDLWTLNEIYQKLGSWQQKWEEIMVFGKDDDKISIYGWLIFFTFGFLVIIRRIKRNLYPS